MKRIWIPTLIAVGAFSLWQIAPTPNVQAGAPVDRQIPNPNAATGSFADVIEAVQPAVVNISVTGPVRGDRGTPRFAPGNPGQSEFEDFLRRFFERQSFDGRGAGQPFRGAGSGFIVSEDGFVVTNNHVVEHAAEILVTMGDGTQHQARLVGTDPKTDLAVLDIESDGPLPFVRFGDSDGTRVGDWVIAIGNPFGLGGSATTGIVSARGRDIQSGPFDDFLQIDAPINSGNSGGPLFNLEGRVIGVNTAIFSPNGGNVGIGFAIPSAQAQTIVEALKTNGRVDRGWLGVTIQGIDDGLAKGLGIENTEGALVASVVPKSPAESAGLLPGDVIVSFDGEPVREVKDLMRGVAANPPDGNIELEVWREGKRQTLAVALGRMPGEAPTEILASKGADSDLGIALGDLDERARRQLDLDEDVDGALIRRVAPEGPAAASGLQPGDVIVMVSKNPVSSAKQAADALAQARSQGDSTVVVRVLRDGGALFVAVPFA